MEYKDQLRTSAWLRKKFEIMERDNFVCSQCLNDNFESQLQVHHITYITGRKAWQYPDYMLVTLCKICHEKEHEELATKKNLKIKEWILKLITPNPLNMLRK